MPWKSSGRNHLLGSNFAARRRRSARADAIGAARYLLSNMRATFRDGLYLGLGLAFLCGFFLMWLWQPERQVRWHTEKLFHQIEAKNWNDVAELIDQDYRDQWNQDRANVVERMHRVMLFVRGMRIVPLGPVIKIDNGRAVWLAKITIEGENDEGLTLMKERINPLSAPFELEWHQASHKPWDWKLFRATNAELQLPTDIE